MYCDLIRSLARNLFILRALKIWKNDKHFYIGLAIVFQIRRFIDRFQIRKRQ